MSRRLSAVSVVLSGRESLTPPGWGLYSFTYPKTVQLEIMKKNKKGIYQMSSQKKKFLIP